VLGIVIRLKLSLNICYFATLFAVVAQKYAVAEIIFRR